MKRRFASGFSRTFVSLGTRNYRLFFIGQLVSNSGNWLTNVALTLLVLDRTGSGTAVGWLVACQYGPILFFSIYAGSIADRVDKRKLLYVTQSLEMAESVLLAVFAFIPGTSLAVFYVIATLGGCLLAADNPARRSFVRELVPRSQVSNAVTLYSSMVNLSRIVGPAIAGLLVSTLGFGWAFAIDAASYSVVIVALIRMNGAEFFTSPRAVKAKGQVIAGVKYIWRTPELAVSFAMLLVIGLLSYNFNVTYPLLVEKGLHGSALQYTLLYSSFSIGALVGTLFVARRTTITLRTIILSAGAFGIALTALAFVPNIPVAYLVAAAVGAVSISYMTATTAMAQLRAEPSMAGRVIAVQTVLQIGTTPIGGPLLGWVADVAGARVPILIGGVAALATFAVAAATARRRMNADPLEEVARDTAATPTVSR
ncbi:MFS transporter [Frondihabitans australicus]|uniref:Putative MFS family arabinose efflux permease n=1 Tax=Frondihabitans australicus TaxID=386892 RepID=A0A495IBY5_9MICO|nr:MFS transporter [Frondihabitans australicus]RKR73507.1 putative MFS family arabinose efflux permease [Frondihabitans australicus]